MHYKKAPGLVERQSKIVRNKTGKCTGKKIKNFIILKLPYCQLKDWYNLLCLIVKTQELQNCTDAAQNWNKLIIKAKLISLLSFALQANKKQNSKQNPNQRSTSSPALEKQKSNTRKCCWAAQQTGQTTLLQLPHSSCDAHSNKPNCWKRSS